MPVDTGIGADGHWNKRALEAEWVIGYALMPLFPSVHLPSMPLCFCAHLPQRLFASKSVCSGATLPKCLQFASTHFSLVLICIRLVLHLSQNPFPLVPISTGVHFPRYPFPCCPFFPNAILVPYKKICSHAVP